jgi:hypothetical protein
MIYFRARSNSRQIICPEHFWCWTISNAGTESPFSGPTRCCDVADLCQAFSQLFEIQTRYREAQGVAQSDRIGIWQDPDPVPPWEWRKAEKERLRTVQNGVMIVLCRWRGLSPNRCSERFRSTGFGPKGKFRKQIPKNGIWV